MCIVVVKTGDIEIYYERQGEGHASVYRQGISDVRIHEIPDAAHNSYLQNPEAFTQTLRALLDGGAD